MKHGHKAPLRPLERLSRLRDFKVEKHQIDPRGWKVLNGDRHPIGKVEDLVIDTSRMTAAYLDVELDAKLFELRDDPHVLVPLSVAQRDGDHHRLIVSRLTVQCVEELNEARARHDAEFWTRWWPSRRATVEDLRLMLADVKIGEEVRIPIGNEEIVVERRQVAPDQPAMANAADDSRRA
jgi:hypothetical protein